MGLSGAPSLLAFVAIAGFVVVQAVLKLGAQGKYSLLLALISVRKALNSITAMLGVWCAYAKTSANYSC